MSVKRRKRKIDDQHGSGMAEPGHKERLAEESFFIDKILRKTHFPMKKFA